MELEHDHLLKENPVQDKALFDLLRLRFFPKKVRMVASAINTLHVAFPQTAFRLTMQCFSVAIRRKLNAKDKAFSSLPRRPNGEIISLP